MLVSEQDIMQFINQYYLPFIRIGAMFMVAPIFSARIVNTRFRLMLALMLGVIVAPLLPPMPSVPLLSFQSIALIVQEMLIGVVVGFVFQVVFQVFVLSGQYMAMKMGLGFASMNDPTNGVQTTVLSQFFLMLVTLMFIAINGHLILISTIIDSFTTFPIGNALPAAALFDVVKLGGWMFASALVIALPVLTALLFVNIAFGVMSRAAPQLNIFAVGFPFTLIMGLVLIWLGLHGFVERFTNVADYGFLFVHDMLGVQ